MPARNTKKNPHYFLFVGGAGARSIHTFNCLFVPMPMIWCYCLNVQLFSAHTKTKNAHRTQDENDHKLSIDVMWNWRVSFVTIIHHQRIIIVIILHAHAHGTNVRVVVWAWRTFFSFSQFYEKSHTQIHNQSNSRIIAPANSTCRFNQTFAVNERCSSIDVCLHCRQYNTHIIHTCE